MKSFTIYLLGILFTTQAYSQHVISGRILDELSSQPVAYVNVGIVNTHVGDLTNAKGYFTLTIPDSLLSRSITIHTPGYSKKMLKINRFSSSTSTIYLSKEVLQLSEVIISESRPALKSLEMVTKEKLSRQSSTTLSQTSSGGAAISTMYVSPSMGFWLEHVRIKVSNNLADSIKLRIRLLQVNENGLPGEDILPLSIVRTTDIKNGWWDIDLRELDVYVPASRFFLCFELIEDELTRKKMEERRIRKSQMMYALYDQGVKGIQVKEDSLGNRIGWSSSLSRKEAEKRGVDFPTGNTYFTVTPASEPSYVRRSSFDQWKPLYNGEFGLVNGLEISYVPGDDKQQPPAIPSEVKPDYPLLWGLYQVGFRSFDLRDSSRFYKSMSYEDGQTVPENTYRPVQVNVWYPTNSTKEKATLLEYVRTLANVERPVPPSDEIDKALLASLNAFGFPDTYTDRLTNAQIDADYLNEEFPLILYLPGLSGDAIENYKLCELMASYGYYVISIPSLGIDAREMQMDVTSIETQQADASFAVNWARSNLQVSEKLGVIGYSWGSMAGFTYALSNHSKVRVFISLDGSLYAYSDLLADENTTYDLGNTESLFVSSRKLDKTRFTLYDKINGKKQFAQLVNSSHDNFISMGVDLMALDESESLDRYIDLASMIINYLKAVFSEADSSVMPSEYIRPW